ncbi:MAG: class I SAM-dependent methyltransferase [Flexilinea sp.]
MPENLIIPKVNILTSPDWQDYELLDSGDGRKLERFGKLRLIRPEAEAVWKKLLPDVEWEKAAAEFIPSVEENGGHWKTFEKVPESWNIRYKGLTLKLMLSNSKQLGVFPEQACQWDWVKERIVSSKHSMHILNLFGYTGAISLAAVASGAKVTHLDASKKAIQWAKENQSLSNLNTDSIRWMIDDGLKFVQREVRRGSLYQGVILDPPKFGRGPKGEVWEFYKGFPELIQSCKNLLANDAEFMLVTAYAIKASSLTLNNSLSEVSQNLGGIVSIGEVCLQDTSGGRLLSMAIYGRWQKNK